MLKNATGEGVLRSYYSIYRGSDITEQRSDSADAVQTLQRDIAVKLVFVSGHAAAPIVLTWE